MEGALAVPAFNADGQLCGVLGVAKAEAHDWTDLEKAAVSAVAALLRPLKALFRSFRNSEG
jgi:DNA-binding IclR family transcriptional regulator